MNAQFSDALLTLAGPRLLWSLEQLDLFDQLVPLDSTAYDLNTPKAERSGISLRAHQIGALDNAGAWHWAWADGRVSDTPGAARSAELRELGTREGVGELAGPVLDLSGFPDPRIAANLLLTMCLGLLDARGCLVTRNHQQEPVFLITDDPAVPAAAPRAGRLEQYLQVVAQLEVPQLKAVKGWCARHGMEPQYGPGRVSATLPDGGGVTANVTGGRTVTGVSVTGPHGGPPADGGVPEQALGRPALPQPAPDEGMFPAALLRVAARHMALSVRGTGGMIEYAGEELGFVGAMPQWDAGAGLLRFPGGGLRTRALGRYDLAEGWFEWAPGTEDVRARFRAEAGLPADAAVPELDGARLGLAPYAKPESAAVLLARTAANVAGGVFTSLGNQFLLVTDDRLPAPGTDPGAATQDIRAGASWLNGLVPAGTRAETMRTVATSYFEHFGMDVMHHGMPEFLSGMDGLYEVRVFFGPDGTIVNATEGMAFMPGQ
ncbi:hypothetical protein DVA86_22055 [Streptomyces armeniacus]|uniref:Uncharacterized protein n=1 Tax=Streptomyces armeniacus TaxID=83291 RepID=A0A345XTG0_9ACTN|nr:DUF6882 domain-containing protein [Streptomyces armeniacus]AXK34926.1 hypothetical protein DVA86_22055 [Streptomyces armeniacus]